VEEESSGREKADDGIGAVIAAEASATAVASSCDLCSLRGG